MSCIYMCGVECDGCTIHSVALLLFSSACVTCVRCTLRFMFCYSESLCTDDQSHTPRNMVRFRVHSLTTLILIHSVLCCAIHFVSVIFSVFIRNFLEKRGIFQHHISFDCFRWLSPNCTPFDNIVKSEQILCETWINEVTLSYGHCRWISLSIITEWNIGKIEFKPKKWEPSIRFQNICDHD